MEKLGAYELVRTAPLSPHPAVSPGTAQLCPRGAWEKRQPSRPALSPQQDEAVSKPSLSPAPGEPWGRGTCPTRQYFAVPSKIVTLSICSVLALTKGQCSGSPWEGDLAGYWPGEPPPTPPRLLVEKQLQNSLRVGSPSCQGRAGRGARQPCPDVVPLQVTGRRLWKNVYDELGGSPGSTSAATCTRRHYERCGAPGPPPRAGPATPRGGGAGGGRQASRTRHSVRTRGGGCLCAGRAGGKPGVPRGWAPPASPAP